MENNLKNLPPFYVGQKVVYVTGKNMPKGVIDVVTEASVAPCGCQRITLKKNKSKPVPSDTTHIRCWACGKQYPFDGRDGDWFASSFRPVQESPFPSLTFKEVIEKEKVLTCNN